MTDTQYAKEALTHSLNYVLIAVFILLMVLTGTFAGWFMLLCVAEVIVWMLSYTEPVRRYLYLQNCLLTKEGMLEAEERVYSNIGSKHKEELQSIRDLCARIEDRLSQSRRRTSTSLMEKMVEVRYKFSKLIELHYLLSQTSDETRNMNSLKTAISENENRFNRETDYRVRATIKTTIDIQKKRLERLKMLGARLRDTEARLNLLKNSLELVFDDVRTSGDSDDTEIMVDGLVASLDLGDLQDITTMELADLRLPTQQQLPAATSRSAREQTNKTYVYEKRR